jgi:hypothetical protein
MHNSPDFRPGSKQLISTPNNPRPFTAGSHPLQQTVSSQTHSVKVQLKSMVRNPHETKNRLSSQSSYHPPSSHDNVQQPSIQSTQKHQPPSASRTAKRGEVRGPDAEEKPQQPRELVRTVHPFRKAREDGNIAKKIPVPKKEEQAQDAQEKKSKKVRYTAKNDDEESSAPNLRQLWSGETGAVDTKSVQSFSAKNDSE